MSACVVVLPLLVGGPGLVGAPSVAALSRVPPPPLVLHLPPWLALLLPRYGLWLVSAVGLEPLVGFPLLPVVLGLSALCLPRGLLQPSGPLPVSATVRGVCALCWAVWLCAPTVDWDGEHLCCLLACFGGCPVAAVAYWHCLCPLRVAPFCALELPGCAAVSVPTDCVLAGLPGGWVSEGWSPPLGQSGCWVAQGVLSVLASAGIGSVGYALPLVGAPGLLPPSGAGSVAAARYGGRSCRPFAPPWGGGTSLCTPTGLLLVVLRRPAGWVRRVGPSLVHSFPLVGARAAAAAVPMGSLSVVVASLLLCLSRFPTDQCPGHIPERSTPMCLWASVQASIL